MAINPYTLNSLYEKGILDYVPTELLMPTPMAPFTATNPYLSMAQQGRLYQNHGMATDSFHSSFTPAYTPNDYQSVSTGSNYGAAAGRYNSSSSYNYNGYGSYGFNNQIGSRSNAGGLTSFNGYGIGSYNNNGMANAYGYDGSIGAMSNAGGVNAFGGFTDTQNNMANGFNKTMNVINRTPKLLLGIAAGVIGLTGIAYAFKRGKKPPKTGGSGASFCSKLNPLNWFRKSK